MIYLWAIYPFLVMLVIATIDVNFKGRRMVSHKWHDRPEDTRPVLPQFWRDSGLVAWRSCLFLLLNILCIPMFFVFGAESWITWRAVIAVYILGSCGVESILYWWLDPLFGVGQEAWWRSEQGYIALIHPDQMPALSELPPPGRVSEGDKLPTVTLTPRVGWFDYPDAAPWLKILPGFWWRKLLTANAYLTADGLQMHSNQAKDLKRMGALPKGEWYRFDAVVRPTRREVYTVAGIGSATAVVLGAL